MTPTIKAIAPWFGGKRTLAPTIIEELGPHRAYWEPFCGSMAVLFTKPVSAHETVNDLHGDLVNLAMVLASDRCPELYDRLRRTLCCEAMFLQAKARMSAPPAALPADPKHVKAEHIERAYWYFVMSWVGRNGVSGTKRYNYQIAVRWTPGGGAGSTRFANAVESIPWFHRRLRRVMILNRDAFDLLAKIDDVAGVAVYVDPPYLLHTRGAAGKAYPGGGSRYQHDFAEADHRRLAEALCRFRHARVVVSYYADPQLAELYPGWTIRAVHRLKNLHLQNRRGAVRTIAPEVLLLNGPSLAAEQGPRGLFEGGQP